MLKGRKEIHGAPHLKRENFRLIGQMVNKFHQCNLACFSRVPYISSSWTRVAGNIALTWGVTKYECHQTRVGACVIFKGAKLVFCFQENIYLFCLVTLVLCYSPGEG